MSRTRETLRAMRRRGDRGQTMIVVLLAVGIFLLAAVGFGVDIANFWFHRQSAQGAADAACTSGAMDMLANATSGSSLGRFPSVNFDCASYPTAVPCQYAALNGYDGKGSSPGNTVQVSFVNTASVPGINSGSIPGIAPNSLRVDVIDHVQTFFTGLLTGNRAQDVHVRATCAVLEANSPIPLIILKPDCTNTLQDTGSGTIDIIGGQSTSIQVNSNDPTGASVTGSGSIDLSHGGPNFTGSNMAVFGGPTTAPGGFNGGTTGRWEYPVTPISDPFALVPPPSVPPASPTDNLPLSVSWPDSVYGCPDHTGCQVYLPGLYVHPIVVKNVTAVFVPGLYYFNIPAGGFAKGNCGTPGGCIAKPTGQCSYALLVDSQGIVRMATGSATGDGSRGLTFYLSGAGGPGGYGSVFMGANAGSTGSRVVDNYDTTNATTGVQCPGGPPPDPNLGLPTTVPGNVLQGPCTKDGTYFTSPTNNSTLGPVRGMLFFQDRANGNIDGQPSMQGGGGLLITGSMYFHNCPNSLTTGCVPATDYKAFLQFQGNSGSGTFLLGNITVDEFNTAGNGTLAMQLDSANVFTILKASLIQ